MRVARRSAGGRIEREMRALARRGIVQARVQQRARVILLAAQGWRNKEIAVEVELDRRQIALWRHRFWRRRRRSGARCASVRPHAQRDGRGGIAHRGRDAARQADRGHALEHAHAGREAGVGATTIRRVWRRNGLKPHRRRPSSSRTIPASEKLVDVVGLYLNPPEHALVLSCDEKSQIQALDRTQPGLPLKAGPAQP